MEMDSKKAEFYSNKKEIEKNVIEESKKFKNKIGKQRRNCWWK